MKRLLVLIMLVVVLLAGCSNVSDIDISQYKYKVEVPTTTYYAQDYEILDGRVILYDAYIRKWGRVCVDVYIISVSMSVSITEQV